MVRTVARSAAAFCIAVALTSCSEEPADRAVTLDDTGDSSAEETTSDGGGGSEVDLDSTGHQLSADEAEAALPTIGDMPTGWSRDRDREDDDEDDDEDVTPAKCADIFDKLDSSSDDVAAEAERAFKESDFGPFLSVQISSYDERVPDETFTTAADTLNECPEWTGVDSEGTKTTYSASSLSFPNLGEETFAIRMGVDAEGWPATVDLVVIRTGHNLVVLTMASIGGGHDAEILENMARLTMDKLAN